MATATGSLVRSLRKLSSTASSVSPLLGRYNAFPTDLVRVNASEKVILRDRASQQKLGRSSFDIVVHEDGMVHPRPGPNFEGPNGASLRPNNHTMGEIIRNFRGAHTTIYIIPKGTKLPSDLVLLHEHSDHHSIQPAQPMTLKELNKKLTTFVQENGEKFSKDQFVAKYPFTGEQ